METYLVVTDITGKQYLHNITDNELNIEHMLVSSKSYNLIEIQTLLESRKTLLIGNRVFSTDKLIEVSIAQYPKGSY